MKCDFFRLFIIIFQAPLSSLEWVIKCFKLISIQLAIAQLLITTASKASGSDWHKTLSTIIFGTFIMYLKWRAKKCMKLLESARVGGLPKKIAGMMWTHTLNTFSNYLTNQLNYFFCAREIYFVFFFYYAGDNKDIAKSRKCEINWYLVGCWFN